MEDVTSLVQAVEGYEETDNPWSDDLERFISHVAMTGDILAPWVKVQKVFKIKLRLVMDEFYSTNPYKVGKVNANATNDDFDEMKKRLLQLAEEFDSPPFTIQRLCELLSKPKKNYTKCDKFMRGLEKNLMVVSSWNNTPRRLSEGNESMMNGMGVGPSNGFNTSDRLKPHWANLPPSPIATAPPKIPGAPDFTDMTAIMPIRNALLEDKEDDPVEHESSVEVETANKETSEQPEEDADKKSNVSATIISSSPPITININIKRKIDDSTDDQQNVTEEGSPTVQVEQSPTKKLKSDAPEVAEKVQENKKEEMNLASSSEKDQKTEESPEKKPKLDVAVDKSDDSANSETDSAEMKNDSTESADSKNSDSTDSQEVESPQIEAKMDTSNEGSSVDPPTAVKIEVEMQMDVD